MKKSHFSPDPNSEPFFFFLSLFSRGVGGSGVTRICHPVFRRKGGREGDLPLFLQI